MFCKFLTRNIDVYLLYWYHEKDIFEKVIIYYYWKLIFAPSRFRSSKKFGYETSMDSAPSISDFSVISDAIVKAMNNLWSLKVWILEFLRIRGGTIDNWSSASTTLAPNFFNWDAIIATLSVSFHRAWAMPVILTGEVAFKASMEITGNRSGASVRSKVPPSIVWNRLL